MKRYTILSAAIALILGASGGAFAASEAIIIQDGSGNDAYIEQEDSEGALATIDQNGKDNQAAIYNLYISDNAVSTINQTGNGNFADIYTYDSDNAVSTINQVGSGNSATIDVDSSFDVNGQIDQFGSDNYAVHQSVGIQ